VNTGGALAIGGNWMTDVIVPETVVCAPVNAASATPVANTTATAIEQAARNPRIVRRTRRKPVEPAVGGTPWELRSVCGRDAMVRPSHRADGLPTGLGVRARIALPVLR
jgi:hypothetical protein